MCVRAYACVRACVCACTVKKIVGSMVKYLVTSCQRLYRYISRTCVDYFRKSLRINFMGGWEVRVVTGLMAVRVFEPVFRNLPHSYTWPLKKNGPIHILDRLKCWTIHILPFDFLHLFIDGSQTNIAVNSLSTKRTSRLGKYLNERYGMHRDTSEKLGLSYTNPEKWGQSYNFAWKKRGLIIYLTALKKGAIRHAHP